MSNKPAFDPNAPFQVATDPSQQQGAKPAFDPSQPFTAAPLDQTAVSSAPQAPVPTLGTALVRGGTQGLALNFADELAGAAGALGGQGYTAARDAYRAQDEAAKKAHPWAYGIANIAGSLPTAALTGGLGEAAELGAVGRAGLTAGIMGAGASNADLTKGDVGGFAKDTGESALLGAGMARASELAAPYVQKLANKAAVSSLGLRAKQLRQLIPSGKLEDMGQAMNDAGIPGFGQSAASTYEKLADKTDELGGQISEAIHELSATPEGQKLIETQGLVNAIKGKLAKQLEYVPDGAELQEKIGDYLDRNLGSRGTLDTAVDPERVTAAKAAEEARKITVPTFNAGEVGSREVTVPTFKAGKAEELGNDMFTGVPKAPYEAQHGYPPGPAGSVGSKSFRVSNESGIDPITMQPRQGLLDETANAGLPTGNPGTAGSKTVDLPAGPTKDPITGQVLESYLPEGAELPPDYYQRHMSAEDAWNVRKGIDSQVNWDQSYQDMPAIQQTNVTTRNMLQQAIRGSLPEESQPLFDQYHLLQTGEKAALGRTAREIQNRAVSPSDYGAMAAGLLHGNAAEGGMMGIANHLVRTRGASTAAFGLTQLSSILQRAPQVFGSFAAPLQHAMQRGPDALAAAHFVLSQSSEDYRNTINKLGDSGAESSPLDQ